MEEWNRGSIDPPRPKRKNMGSRLHFNPVADLSSEEMKKIHPATVRLTEPTVAKSPRQLAREMAQALVGGDEAWQQIRGSSPSSRQHVREYLRLICTCIEEFILDLES